MKVLYSIVILLTLTSCLHSVSLSMFPKEKSLINYQQIRSTQKLRNSNLRFGSKQEFYFEDDFDHSEDLVLSMSKLIVEKEGFWLNLKNTDEDYLIFEKGLSAESWKSMIGVYYDIDTDNKKIQMYFLYQMTQDITGSFDFNYAEAIGLRIQQSLALAK